MKSQPPGRARLLVAPLLLAAIFSSGANADDKQTGTAGGAPGRPPFESLLRFNGARVFGGKVTSIAGDRIEVLYDGPGQMTKGFEGQGILDPGSQEMKGSYKKFIMKDKDHTIPGVASVGLSGPNSGWTTWISRFPLAGDPSISFDLRLPSLVTSQSSFYVRLNQDGKSYLETNFLRTAEKHVRGSVVSKKETTLKEYATHPMKWFPRNKPEGLPITVAVKGDRFQVSIGQKEVVGLEKIGEVSKGKVAFVFSKIAFTLQNVKVSGKIDREWCASQLADLEKEGKLLLKDPDAPDYPPLPGGPPAGDAGKKADEGKPSEGEKRA